MTSANDDWRLPSTLQQAMSDLSSMSNGGKNIRLVAGNTSTGECNYAHTRASASD